MGPSANSLTIPLLAAAAGALAALVVVIVVRLLRFKRKRLEAATGLGFLNGMSWSELDLLLLQALRVRGYEPATTPRRPAEDGYDLLVQRGSEKYLVQCKQGGAFAVGAGAVRELLALIATHDASGAILITTAHFDRHALEAARHRPIQLLEGEALWKDLKPFVAAPMRMQVERTVAAESRRYTVFQAIAVAVVAMLSYAGTLLWLPPVGTALPAPTQSASVSTPARVATPAVQKVEPPAAVKTAPPTSIPTTTTAPASVVSAPAPLPASPTTAPAPTPAAAAPAPKAIPAPAAAQGKPPQPQELSEAEQLQRRIAAREAVKKIAGISGADWSTKSTLVIGVVAQTEAQREPVVEKACAAVVAFEELRYTRLQVENALARTEAQKNVRWRQCK